MASTRDLEKEYDPTQWSKRFDDPKALLASHVEFGRKTSDNNRYSFNCTLNIPYGESARQKLDIYGVNLPANAPIIVFIHGGYWQGMNKYTSAYAIKPYVENGAKVFVVDHDLCPDVNLEDVVEQFQKATEFIINRVSAEGAKSVSFVGHLSGAHLIASMLNKDFIDRIGAEKFKLIKSVNLISGIYDLNELKDTKCANRDNLLSLTEANVAALSPSKHSFGHLKSFNIKFFAFTGANESPTLQQQSKDFATVLNLSGLTIQLKEIDNLDHFNIVEKLSESDYEITKIILLNL